MFGQLRWHEARGLGMWDARNRKDSPSTRRGQKRS